VHQSQQELFNDDLLVRRLNTLGLSGVRIVESHENHSVMVSLTTRRVLRVHRAFAYAPDSVLRSIVVFADPRTRSPRRRSAQRVILAFPVDAYVRKRRPRRKRPQVPREDRPILGRLANLHRELNERFFGGALSPIRFRVSRRMRRKLGELALDPTTDRPLEIAIGHVHIQRDGWREVGHTLLHEMIHQWQAESDLPVDHGAIFRRKAREVGVAPRAMRDVGRSTPK
jgi:hypothetical protein